MALLDRLAQLYAVARWGAAPATFARGSPTPQAAVDLFAGDWASRLPLSGVHSGHHELFDDGRVKWFLDQIGGVADQRIIELGPLEGAHSALLEGAAAREVVAIESSSRAFLKCLVVKELLGLTRTRFLFGDFRAYLRQTTESFDVAVACGVLYHLRSPHELFPELIARCTGPVLLWTHYFSERRRTAAFGSVRQVRLASGQTIELHEHRYGDSMFASRFLGGNAAYSEWLTRDGLLAAIENAGYRVQAISHDEPDHPNGPAVAFVLVPSDRHPAA